MRPFEEIEMDPRDFEQQCEDLVGYCLHDKQYRIKNQRRQIYGGRTKIMDIYIAERKQGGRHYVIDCKHFTTRPLDMNEIQTTLEYKRLSRASKAIILISGKTNCPPRIKEFAKSQDVPIIRVSIVNSDLVNRMKRFFFGKAIRRAIS